MKYNKSEIMKNAWAIRRTENVTMSSALKKAWANAKNEGNAMKGTEKQIVWATEIRANVIKSLGFIKANSPANTQAEAQKRIDLLNEEGVYAGDIIDAFKDIRFGSDEMRNARNVMAIYGRGYIPHTSTGKRMLCK